MEDKNPNKTNFRPGVIRQDLPDFHQGTILRASQLHLMVDAIESNSLILTEHGYFGREEGIGRIKAYNIGQAIDAWQLVELNDISEYDPIIPDCRVPTADGLELLGLTIDKIERDTAGWVNIYGAGVVQCPVGAVAGDHLGSANGSTVPQADSDGPLIVVGTFTLNAVLYAVVIWAAGAGGYCIPVWEVTAVGGGSCTVVKIDSAGVPLVSSVLAGISYLTEPQISDRGILLCYTDGSLVLLVGTVTYDPTPDVEVGTWEELEDEELDKWDIGDGTLKYRKITRFAYDNTRDAVLYAFYRDHYYSAAGHLTRITTEHRVTIDTPQPCVSSTTTTTAP